MKLTFKVLPRGRDYCIELNKSDTLADLSRKLLENGVSANAFNFISPHFDIAPILLSYPKDANEKVIAKAEEMGIELKNFKFCTIVILPTHAATATVVAPRSDSSAGACSVKEGIEMKTLGPKR